LNDATRQLFALASFIVGGAIIALLVGHATQTGQLVTASLGGFNTLINTLENPQAGTSTLGSTTLSGSTIGSTLTGIGNLTNSLSNLFGSNQSSGATLQSENPGVNLGVSGIGAPTPSGSTVGLGALGG
jgi:hypothetical protein